MKKNTSSKRDQYTAVLEDIRSNNKAFGEALSAFRDQTIDRFDQMDKKLDSHTEIINSHTEMLGNILVRLEEVKNEFKQKVDYQDFAKLQIRVAHLEAMGGSRR